MKTWSGSGRTYSPTSLKNLGQGQYRFVQILLTFAQITIFFVSKFLRRPKKGYRFEIIFDFFIFVSKYKWWL